LDQKHFLEIVRDQLKTKKMSLRKLALRAEISTGKLSEILNEKKPLSPYYISKLSRALELNSTDHAQKVSNFKEVSRPDRMLKEDELCFIQQWYHLAILNLIKTENTSSSAKWISQRLLITEEETTQALERLTRLKLVEEKDGQLVRTNGFTTTTNNIPSEVIRTMHEEMIKKSLKAVRDVSVDFRDISYITMAINPEKIKKAKEEIKLFRRKIAKILETDPSTEVYSLCVQLIPLTKIQDDQQI